MDAQTINFMTWNVNGLKQNRDQKFQKIQNANIVFLQETHIGLGDELTIENYKDKWTVFYTKYNSSSKGTAILVSKRLDFEYISDEKDNYGAYVVLKCKLAGQPYTLVSVYNHQTDTKTLDNLSRYLQSMTTGLLLIGGDFNTVLNPFIDKKCNTSKMIKSRNHHKLYLFVQKFMKSLQLVDVWRKTNPVKQDFTFYIKDCPVSRLDYFFVPEECMWRVRSCEIRNSEISESKDHKPVYLKINNVSTVPKCQKHLHTQPQLLIHKKDALTDERGSLLDAENSNAVSEVDIISAIQSLQVSDTPRPDGIPVSFYKDNIQDLIPYIKTVYDRIHRGAFNCSQNHFNEPQNHFNVKSLHDERQHFFNVDYLIIATILGRQLDDIIESHSKGHVPKNSAMIMITPKSLCTQISLSFIKNEIEKQKLSSTTLSLKFLSMENLLSDPKEVMDYRSFPDEKYKLLHQGCPLTPGLITLALKSYVSQLFGHLKMHGIFIFKENVIACFEPDDEKNVKSIVESSANEIYNVEILSRGNNEDWDEWVTEALGNEEEIEKRNEETEFEFEKKEDQSLEIHGRSAIFSEISGNEMESSHRRTSNPPPLLPVASQSSTSFGGIKRKRDHEHFIVDLTQTTDNEIMERAKQIMKRIPQNPDQVDKSSNNKATIGIFGKSGEGKSSLLSAVFGKKDLLPSGCFGACTAVVTQVEANLTDSNYTAEIELFSKEEWEKELKDLFRNIKDECKDRNDDLKEVAVEKITALYGADAAKKTLEELRNDDKFAKIENFLFTNKEKFCFSKSDVNEFANDVANYIQHSEACPGGWYWPLVKGVTIKIPDCKERMEHIVLVDLPGTGDCNKIRDDLWKSKLSECSFVWIVSAINRAIDDRDPWGILKHCIEELGPGGKCKSISFICTKTDEINEKAFMRCARLLIPNSVDEKKACILHRNEHAKTKVKEKFENSEIKKIFNADNQFQVFTVSSNAFFEPNLNLECFETEIPNLQDTLKSLNKSINQELIREYVNKSLGTLLLIQSGHLDTDTKMMEMKVKISMEFEKNLKKSLNELNKYFDTTYNDLEQCLSKGVEESVQLCVASTKELIAPNKDGRGFHKILSALCKNYGCYWSKHWDVVLDLNKTLAKPLGRHIDVYFGQIFPVTGKTEKSVQEQIDKFSIIQTDSGCSSSPILLHIHDFIKIEETKLKVSLSRDIVDRKKDIYSSIQITIVNEMASCYEQAAALKGIGAMKKMQNLLLTTINEIKQDMFTKAKMELLEKFNNLKLYIMNTLEEKLKTAIERSQSHTKNPWMDVSKEIKELERLLELLSD